MDAALVFSGPVQFRVRGNGFDFDHSGTNVTGPTHGYKVEMDSFYQFNSFLVLEGLFMSLQSSDAGTVAKLRLAVLDLDETAAIGGFQAECESILTLTVRIYSNSTPTWDLHIDDAEWEVGGSPVTLPTTTGQTYTNGLGPNFLPIFGQLPYATFDWWVGGVIDSYPNPWEFDESISGVLGCGWRVKRTGDTDWYEAPIAIKAPVVPDCMDECQVCESPTGMLSGSTTWDLTNPVAATANSKGAWFQESGATGTDLYIRNKSSRSGCGWLQLLPNESRGIIKMLGDDFACMVERGGFPEVLELGERVCGPYDPGSGFLPYPSGRIESATDVILPEGTAFLEVIRASAAGTIEAPTTETIWLPYAVTRFIGQGPWLNELGVGSNPVGTYPVPPAYPGDWFSDSVTYAAGWSVQCRSLTGYQSANSALLPYINYDGASAAPGDYGKWLRLSSFWGAPWWSYGEKGFNWEIDGDDTDSWISYWGNAGQQFLNHPSLPSEQNSDTRIDLISSPAYMQNGNREFMEVKAFGFPQPWAGIWNFKLRPWSIPASITLNANSEDRWTIKDEADVDLTATSTFGVSGITVPVADDSIDYIAEADLCSWTIEPWMITAIAQKFENLRDTASVDALKLVLVGVDGSEYELPSSAQTAGGAAWPTSGLTSTKYAGTYGHDFGYGAITDQGTDEAGTPTGDSPAMVGDAVRVCVPQLLPGRTAKTLRIVATPKPGATSLLIQWPKFYTPTSAPTIVHLNRWHHAVLWPDGPGIVLGSLNWWDYDLEVQRTVPVPQSPGTPTTILDAYCTQRAFEGADPTANVNTDLATLYDDVECPPAMGTRAKQAARTHCWAFPTILSGSVNWVWHVSFSCPPMPMFPGPARHATTLSPVDASGFGGVWEWASEPRRLILPYKPSNVKEPPSTIWTSPSAIVVSGWKINEHRHLVDNTESGFKVVIGGTNFAEVRPWHGWLWIYGQPEPSAAGGVDNTHSDFGHYHRVSVADGKIVYSRANWYRPPFDDVTVISDGPDDSDPSVDVDCYGDARVVFVRDGSIYLGVSTDEGRTISTPALVATGVNPRAFSDRRGYRGMAWFAFNSGTSGPGKVKLKVKEPGGSDYGSTITIPIDFEPFGFGITCPPEAGCPWILTATPEGDSEPAEYESTDDGASWALL